MPKLWDSGLGRSPNLLLTPRGKLTYILVGRLVCKRPKGRKRRLRDPEHTRNLLLQVAFREVYRWGLQGAGLDTILATTGALYYHFGSPSATMAYPKASFNNLGVPGHRGPNACRFLPQPRTRI